MLVCPGRTLHTAQQFANSRNGLADYQIMVLDCAGAELAYASQSPQFTLCTSEKYLLETHKFLSLPTAEGIVRDVWTDPDRFNSGLNIPYVESRLKWLNFKSARRNTSGWNWTDVATYYCLLAQGGFSYYYDRWSLRIDKNNPTCPNFAAIKEFSEVCRGRTKRYRRRNLFKFPIHEADKQNTILHIHVPVQFSQYGCGYVWTRRKLNFVQTQLVELADLGYKVCVSALHTRWGREIPVAQGLLPARLFRPEIFTVLKDSSRYGLDNTTKEIYYVAGF